MWARSCIPLVLALALGGCAFMNPRNTPALNTLDRAVPPETTLAKIALAPVFIPVGVACGALDICVLHPARAAGYATEDTRRVVWADSRLSHTEQALLLVPKAAVSPVVFIFCWFGESVFDLRPERTGEPQ